MEYPFRVVWMKRGFTLVEIMVTVMIIAILLAVGTPNFLRSRRNAETSAVLANLSALDAAAQEWANDFQKGPQDVPTQQDLLPYLKNGWPQGINRGGNQYEYQPNEVMNGAYFGECDHEEWIESPTSCAQAIGL